MTPNLYEETKKEVIERLLVQQKIKLYEEEIMERFYSRQLISAKSGKQQLESVLAGFQNSLKERKSIIAFLQEILKEEK